MLLVIKGCSHPAEGYSAILEVVPGVPKAEVSPAGAGTRRPKGGMDCASGSTDHDG